MLSPTDKISPVRTPNTYNPTPEILRGGLALPSLVVGPFPRPRREGRDKVTEALMAPLSLVAARCQGPGRGSKNPLGHTSFVSPPENATRSSQCIQHYSENTLRLPDLAAHSSGALPAPPTKRASQEHGVHNGTRFPAGRAMALAARHRLPGPPPLLLRTRRHRQRQDRYSRLGKHRWQELVLSPKGVLQ